MDEEQITALQDKLHNEIMVALTEVIDFDAQAN
jgi:queuine/archaeosine tRNA-ribosyltransferase